jgi:protein-disulfide isomerase
MFEKNNHAAVDKLVAEKKVRVEYHIVSLIDQNTNGKGSGRSANAAACAYTTAGRDTFMKYHDVLYSNQPSEETDSYAQNSKLLLLAKQVPGLTTAKFTSCVNNGTYDSWAKKVMDDFNAKKIQGTPTILIDGKQVQNPTALTPATLQKAVDAASK